MESQAIVNLRLAWDLLFYWIESFDEPPPEYNLLYLLTYFGVTIQYFASGNDSRTYHQILEKTDFLSYRSVSRELGNLKV